MSDEKNDDNVIRVRDWTAARWAPYPPIVPPKTYTKADIIKLAEELAEARRRQSAAYDEGPVEYILACQESVEAEKLYNAAFSIWYRAGKPE
jgi:hypothetical protein